MHECPVREERGIVPKKHTRLILAGAKIQLGTTMVTPTAFDINELTRCA